MTKNDASETPQAGNAPTSSPAAEPAAQASPSPAQPEATYDPPAPAKPVSSDTANGWRIVPRQKNGLVRVTAYGPDEMTVTADAETDAEARAAVLAQIQALTGQKEG